MGGRPTVTACGVVSSDNDGGLGDQEVENNPKTGRTGLKGRELIQLRVGNKRKPSRLLQGFEPKSRRLLRKSFRIFSMFLGLKSKDSNTFKPNLNWNKIKINSNQNFGYFSNLELLKIDLNIQIQAKALNGRLLNKKRFQNEI
jgi:hypothetical protein